MSTCVTQQRVASHSLALKTLNHISASYVTFKFFWNSGPHCSLLDSYLSSAPDNLHQSTVELSYLYTCSGHFVLGLKVLICLLRYLSGLNGTRFSSVRWTWLAHRSHIIYIYIYIYIYIFGIEEEASEVLHFEHSFIWC